jgi:tRNA 2-thiocytidine biosynthesis protein TtcA
MRTEEQRNKERLFRKICNKTGKTILEHNMLEEGDRLLVGLSGGKDSYILLEALANRRKALPFKFNLTAIHVSIEQTGYQIDNSYMIDFCRKMEVPFIHKRLEIDLENQSKSPCFLCSWNRRKTIFDVSKELKCNKIAFGHHRDDALETFMMNMLYHGSISSMPYKLKMFEGRVHLIRPLLSLWEEELLVYSQISDFPIEEKKCKYDDQTKRFLTRNILKELYDQYPASKTNMFNSMGNIYEEYLPEKSIKKKKNNL